MGDAATSKDEARLSELDVKVTDLRNRHEELNREAERWKKERDRLNESRDMLRAEALRHREARDDANRQVADLKKTVGSLRDVLDEKRSRLSETDVELERRRRQLQPRKKVESKLGGIEWEIMTTPTLDMLPREKELNEEAKELARELGAHRDLEGQIDGKLLMMADAKAIELKIRESKDEMSRLHGISEENHQKMLLLREQIEGERQKADEAHLRFRETLSSIKVVKGELGDALKESRGLQMKFKETRGMSDAERNLVIEAKKRELIAEARSKLEAGEKLSFDELKLIYEGEEDSDEE